MSDSEVTETKSSEPGAKDLNSNPPFASYFVNLGTAS